MQKLSIKQYAGILGVSSKTAAKYYKSDCATLGVKYLTIAHVATINGLSPDEVRKSLSQK